ncbi:GNAT family N-acetyltransferase [uncultured Eudoraea sp.]|uniref:GNAT family N-acetyltransferase n=1 Tax=uncultured Eudoraea sp. TaxID=1035614 RepID=UPI0026350C4C|nr:GNAT family N-acetyltransferase [uncultured Eudoraea sp.]
MINIIRAKEEHIPTLIPLLDKYRIFYNQNSDEQEAQRFLEARIKNKDSIIFIAFYDGSPAGFTQLYSSFSTVGLKPIFILNDLYVYNEFRKKGIGEVLLNSAKDYCILLEYKGLALGTAINNPAQKLYERLGWKKNTSSLYYFWEAK